MRELSVFYCPRCGRYGYYQLRQNAVCTQCSVRMLMLSVSCAQFLQMDPAARDQLITDDILNSAPLITDRILAADRAHDNRRCIAELTSRIRELEEENRKLNETINWMHQTIWELLAQRDAAKSGHSGKDS